MVKVLLFSSPGVDTFTIKYQEEFAYPKIKLKETKKIQFFNEKNDTGKWIIENDPSIDNKYDPDILLSHAFSVKK